MVVREEEHMMSFIMQACVVTIRNYCPQGVVYTSLGG